jgi:hypothetical protein
MTDSALGKHVEEAQRPYLKRIMLEDSFCNVRGQKLAHIISAVAKSHLCQVICSKREEVGMLRNLKERVSSMRVYNLCKSKPKLLHYAVQQVLIIS